VSAARDEILGRIRSGLGRGPLGATEQAALTARLDAHRRNLVPARAASLDHRAQLDLFIAMAREVDATVNRVPAADVPAAIAHYLAEHNFPSRVVMTQDAALDEFPWVAAPMLEIRRGVAEDGDTASVTACFAGIAETGTLMLLSGPARPTRNNFLPDTHIVVVRADQVMASYEDGFERLRAGAMPRTVNFITGPSRTADIEQRLELGMHGPRRLHIILVDEAPA
jgi:L-lactate dehydrogenase complex protein LldG